MVDRVNICLATSLTTEQNLVVSHTVCTHVGLKNLGMLGTHSLGQGHGRRTEKPYMCYHTKFSRCRSSHLGISKGPKNLGDTGPCPLGVWLTLEMLRPHLRYHAKFGHSRSNCMAIIMEICQKILTPHIPLLNVTQGHWNSSGHC